MSAEPGGQLAGARILVTRPAAQAGSLCRMIEAEGGQALRLPLLSIEPVVSASQARQLLAAGHDAWIFTSANAARHSASLINGPWPARVAAVGPATAAALAGAPLVTLPLGGASSDALLELPEFREVRGQRVLLVTGEGGLRQIERELEARGASVERAEVYRRVPLPYPPETVASFLRRSAVLVLTSSEALEQLQRVTPVESHGLLKRKPLVLPSTRVVERAQDMGFGRAVSVEGPMSDAALLAACAQILQAR